MRLAFALLAPALCFACSSSDGPATAGDAATNPGDGATTTNNPSDDSGTEPGQDVGTDPGDPFAQARVDCVDTINQYRASLNDPNVKPYVGWTSANGCVDGQAKSDSESGTAHGAFGKCGEFAQDECPGWSGTPESIVKDCLAMMWAEGPGTDFSKHGHYINMSSTKYTMASCGFYQTPSGSWWAAQDFK